MVPTNIIQEVLELCHNNILAGHFGQKMTLQKLYRQFYWQNMKEQVNSFVNKCQRCQANKRPRRSPRAPLGSMKVGAPMDRLGLDLVIGLPVTAQGNKHLLVIIDYFTKWVELYAIPDMTAEVCLDKLLEFICRFGSPLQVNSDQGRQFIASIFSEMCDLLEIKKPALLQDTQPVMVW